MKRHFAAMRSSINPQTKIEDALYNAKTIRALYEMMATLKEQLGDDSYKWRHVYFFFRGMRHIQYSQGPNKVYYQVIEDLEMRELQTRAFQVVSDVLQKQGFIKSFQMLRVIELAMLCKFDIGPSQSTPVSANVWKTFED